MKIDLHCHTMATKDDEPITRNVTAEKFKEKIELCNIEMLAITNHNFFDKEQYNKFKDLVKDTCYVIPGIEFDVRGTIASSIIGHILVIADPNDVDIFDKKVKEICGSTNPNKFVIDSHKLYDEFKSMNVVYIAHLLKDKSLSEEDLEDLSCYMEKSTRLLKEASNIVGIGVLQCNNHRAIIGSDVQDWEKYEESHFGEIKFNLKDYASLTKLIDKDSQLIEDLINENFEEKVTVYGDSEKNTNPFIIPIFNDVNIIFGDKGSGKSEILNSLNSYYIGLGEKPIKFEGGNKDAWYKELIKNYSEDFNLDNIDNNCSSQEILKEIKNYTDETIISIRDYYKYYKDSSSNKRKEKMKCLNIELYHIFNKKKYLQFYQEYKATEKFISELAKFDYKINHEIEVDKLIADLNILKNNIYNEYQKEWLYQYSMKYTDSFVNKMNLFVSQNIGVPSMPKETGLYKFIKNRIELRDNCNLILKTLNKSNNKEEYIGKLGIKGKVYLSKNYQFINEKNKEKLDAKTLNGTKTELVDIIENMIKINKDCSNNNIPKFIDIIKKRIHAKSISDLTSFISVSKSFVIDSKPYKPSKGELAILSLQHDLLSKKDGKIYLIDEPELNLGSTYINQEIVPLLKDLSKAKKKIIVATHDANIAVRTRPSNSILKIVDNGDYSTYIGNMFTDNLFDIASEKILSWRDESIKYLEGGKNAFDERGDLYE